MKPGHFVIYGQGRSGSSLLVSLLNTHPHVRCYGELFHANQWQGWLKHLFHRWVKRHPQIYLGYKMGLGRRPVSGFKLMVNQNEKLDNLLAQLVTDNWRVIHLRRSNLWARSISAAMLQTTGISHNRVASARSLDKIFLDPEILLSKLKHSTYMEEREAARMQGVSCLELVYEDDLEDPAAWPITGQKLIEYLRLPPAPMKSNLVKTWDRPYSELIANYADLVDFARQNGYGVVE